MVLLKSGPDQCCETLAQSCGDEEEGGRTQHRRVGKCRNFQSGKLRSKVKSECDTRVRASCGELGELSKILAYVLSNRSPSTVFQQQPLQSLINHHQSTSPRGKIVMAGERPSAATGWPTPQEMQLTVHQFSSLAIKKGDKKVKEPTFS